MDWCTFQGSYQRYSSYEALLRRGTVMQSETQCATQFLLQNSAGHFPSPWRVNVVLANQPEFAQDFHCPAGAGLNPPVEETCSVW
jgi:predicted metalloendopeptidase